MSLPLPDYYLTLEQCVRVKALKQQLFNNMKILYTFKTLNNVKNSVKTL